MTLATDIFLFLHFLGLGALFGGLFTQLRGTPRVVNPAVLHGALTQVVTGLVLVGLHEMREDPVPEQFHLKIGVKLLVATVILVLAFVHRKSSALGNGPFWTLLGLTVLNIAVAVFWNLT